MAAYVIAEVNVTDLEGYEAYRAQVPAAIANGGGTYKVRGGAVEAVEGDPPAGRIVVLEFADMAAAKAWYHGEEYQKILPLRLAASQGRLFMVEGV